jgi:hypothetical protein
MSTIASKYPCFSAGINGYIQGHLTQLHTDNPKEGSALNIFLNAISFSSILYTAKDAFQITRGSSVFLFAKEFILVAGFTFILHRGNESKYSVIRRISKFTIDIITPINIIVIIVSAIAYFYFKNIVCGSVFTVMSIINFMAHKKMFSPRAESFYQNTILNSNLLIACMALTTTGLIQFISIITVAFTATKYVYSRLQNERPTVGETPMTLQSKGNVGLNREPPTRADSSGEQSSRVNLFLIEDVRLAESTECARHFLSEKGYDCRSLSQIDVRLMSILYKGLIGLRLFMDTASDERPLPLEDDMKAARKLYTDDEINFQFSLMHSHQKAQFEEKEQRIQKSVSDILTFYLAKYKESTEDKMRSVLSKPSFVTPRHTDLSIIATSFNDITQVCRQKLISFDWDVSPCSDLYIRALDLAFKKISSLIDPKTIPQRAKKPLIRSLAQLYLDALSENEINFAFAMYHSSELERLAEKLSSLQAVL